MFAIQRESLLATLVGTTSESWLFFQRSIANLFAKQINCSGCRMPVTFKPYGAIIHIDGCRWFEATNFVNFDSMSFQPSNDSGKSLFGSTTRRMDDDAIFFSQTSNGLARSMDGFIGDNLSTTPTGLVSVHHSTKTKSSSSSGPAGGEPGAGPNAVGNQSSSLSATVSQNESSEDKRSTQGVTGLSDTVSRVADFPVKSVGVGIGIPKSFYRQEYIKEAIEKDPSLDPSSVVIDSANLATLKDRIEKKIQDIVGSLLPNRDPGDDPADYVNVFESPEFPEPIASSSSIVDSATTWLSDSWESIAMLVFGLVALFIARGAIKGGTGGTPSDFEEGFGLELPAPPPELEEEDEDDQLTITGGTLQDELTKIVDANPEVAANVIRGWVGEAA